MTHSTHEGERLAGSATTFSPLDGRLAVPVGSRGPLAGAANGAATRERIPNLSTGDVPTIAVVDGGPDPINWLVKDLPRPHGTALEIERRKSGAVYVSEVLTEAPGPQGTAADALVDLVAVLGLEQWLSGASPEVEAAFQAVDQAAAALEAQRGGRTERLDARRTALFDQLDRLRLSKVQDYTSGVLWKAAGELMCAGGVVPSAWEDSIDPNCLLRGAMAAAGMEGGLVPTPNDGPGGLSTPPPVLIPTIVPAWDLQFGVRRALCLEETGPDWLGSDELIIRTEGDYTAGRIQLSEYDRTGFDTGTTMLHDPNPIELLRVRLQLSPAPTIVTALFAPIEKEIDLSSTSVDAIGRLFDALVDAGAAAASAAAAQSVPGVGAVLAGIVSSMAVKGFAKEKLRELRDAIVAFLASDRFSVYTFRGVVAWSDPTQVPVIAVEMRATRADGSEFYRALPPGPVSASRVITGLPTTQQSGDVRQVLSRPGRYELDHLVRAFRR